ncbi:hypothetical protein CASFOL_024337 [Castilleja foliolosa]|uniref:non-specific serine/threonine protein kinase n=1 Tax=Castilleja foliolosa TaxID=1961234 RepID=A0ABD3CNX8_9LAMI
MALAQNLFLLFLFLLFLLNPADSANCPASFECGGLGTLEFPFSDQPGCGLFMLANCSTYPEIQFVADGRWYGIIANLTSNRLLILDRLLQEDLINHSCMSFRNLVLPQTLSSFSTLTVSHNLTLFGCIDDSYGDPLQEHFDNYTRTYCRPFDVYYRYPETSVPLTDDIPPDCSVIQVPINTSRYSGSLFDLVTGEYILEWSVSEECYRCHHDGGKCLTNSMNVFHCARGKRRLLLIASTVSGAGVLLVVGFLASFILWQRKKRRNEDYLLSRNLSFDPSSKPDVEGKNTYFGIPIFSYTELEEATNSFDSSKELGDGGFGTVYYGKLRDGREVAIKRLYEHNYRRVEQFMNEIKILTCLRHKNLVSLYGCTSRRSRELLLVYEYISNGTVAEHLHGERAKESPLSWPVRMSVAIETANALSYLHKSDIIHRDVKTCNILLEDNFCVKVADFGLSRLFPNDVTHISTAPQGTPGYVDPEYHQCYQLTDKSDVYSFGVVLIELISSMPAVDITRHRHEINLANLAVNRIQRCAFDELIDPSIGYNCDAEVTRMATSVAELAFRCLQLDKDMRPSMNEVVDFLRDIQGGEDCKYENVKGPACKPGTPETDDAVLLKKKNFLMSSPNAVTDSWASSSSTNTSSIG